MSRRFKIGTFFGIGLYVHWSFFLLPLWIAYLTRSSGGAWIDVGLTMLFVLVLFTCVILHEYGHVLAARAFGVGTRDITMLPIGGVARLERMPAEPWQELIVAVAGPAVNALIAVAIGMALLVIGLADLGALNNGNQFAEYVLGVNLALIAFNMIPAFPMDGGRVFRSLIAMCTDYRRATWWAMRVGQVMAVVLAIVGIANEQVFLPFIAAFIFWVGTMEYRQVDLSSRVKNLRVRDAMVRNFITLPVDSSFAEIARQATEQLQQDFPVVADGKFRGMILQRDLSLAMKRLKPPEQASEIIRFEAITLSADELLEDVIASLPRGSHQFPVLDSEEHVVGLLDTESALRRVALRDSIVHEEVPGFERIDRYSP